jgi:type II secretory pathway pseudopilin PulG
MDESSFNYPVGKLTIRRRIAKLFTSGDWMARILIESVLVVFSILAALGVNQWQNTKQNDEKATQAIAAFRREIEQNRARLVSVAPVHRGLRDAVQALGGTGMLSTAEQFHQNLPPDQLRPPFLTETVWETSLTTGAIPHIEFDIVNALSLTYSIQERFTEFSRTSMPTLARGVSVPPEEMPAAVREVIVYLADLSRGEAELLAAYEEVLRILQESSPADSSGTPAAAPGTAASSR